MEGQGPAAKIATMADKIRKLSEELQDVASTKAPEPPETKKERRGGYQLVVYHDDTEKQILEEMVAKTGMSANGVYKEALRKWSAKMESDTNRRTGHKSA